MRVSVEWLKDFCDLRVSPKLLASRLTMAGLEVESIEQSAGDAVFEIGVTPNRADCLSIAGIAREAATLSGLKFRLPGHRPPKGEGAYMKDFVRISVKSSRLCPRYTSRVIDGVKIGPSPSWMAKRLAKSGVRSINNVVDATNFVMLEMGQPLHAFDLKLLRGGQIVIRTSGAAQDFATLDGEKREIVKEDLLICDGEGPVALAGVMGGENSQVRDSTTQILLESAYFEPRGIRRTSKRTVLSTESSRRFERGVDPDGVLSALNRLTKLILETAGGSATRDWVDIYPQKIKPLRLTLDESEIERILGVPVGVTQVVRILSSLGICVKRAGRGRFIANVPTFRPDITRPIDLIEEIARIHGYDKIPETMPQKRLSLITRPKYMEQESWVRDVLSGRGFSEAVLLSFTSEEKILPFALNPSSMVRITNPLSADQSVMCTTLIPGLLDAVKLNLSRQRSDCRIFALQKVFLRQVAMGPSIEPRRIAGAITGRRCPGAWERSKEVVDFYDAKASVEAVLSSLGLGDVVSFQAACDLGFLHSGRAAWVLFDGRRMGFVGELHPDCALKWDISQRVFVFELDFDELAALSNVSSRRFRESSRFPFVERDIAIVVDVTVLAAEVEKVIGESGIDIMNSARIFDVYCGPGMPAGKKSMAVSLRFLKDDRTLTDDKVQLAQKKIVDDLGKKLGAVLRT